MVDPTGVPAIIEIKMPDEAQNTDKTAEQTVTARKLLNTRIADSAGNTTNADINREPTKFIAKTITTAIITAISRLYKFALTPVARAKFSSKVTEKIL